MLHTPIYDVRGMPYCGPTAIAAITGEPISIIRDVIRSHRGTVKKNGHAMPVMGITNGVMLRTMEVLGWHVIVHGRDLTGHKIHRLRDFLDLVQMGRIKGPHIVHVTGHYYAVDEDELCDTHLRIPMDIHRFKRGRMRWVLHWWKFEKDTT